MLLLAEWRTLSCSGCGGWLPETTMAEDESAYVVPPPFRCKACTAKAQAQEAHGKDHKHLDALRWTVRPSDPEKLF
jgi:hypothetical protein